MKVSIVIAVLNSHEIVRRQLLHWGRMDFGDNVEWVIVDDGSTPPLADSFDWPKNFIIHATNNFDEWTQPMARNIGAELAHNPMLICTDIDHILTEKTIQFVCDTYYDVIHFIRHIAVLDENGNFTQDGRVLASWNVPPERIAGKKYRVSPHSNSYGIRRDRFLKLGGSRQGKTYPNRDEIPLKRKLKVCEAKGRMITIPDDERPLIYVMPTGRFCGDGRDKDFNPFGYFHNLKRWNDAA